MANEPTFTTNNPAPVMARRLFLLGASALTLAACSGIVGPPEAAPIYMLRTNFAPSPGPKVNWVLAVGIPNASNTLNTDRIALRRENNTEDYYANAVWSDRLPELVQTALLAKFQNSGRIDAVARDQDALHVDYVLGTDIRDFNGHYDQAGGVPGVTVTLIAQMRTARGRKIVSTFTATQTAAAAADSVEAVVEALNTAMAAALQAILVWALALPAPAGA